MNQDNTATAVLQIVRLKGRVNAATLADSLGLTQDAAQAQLAAWLAAEAIQDAKGQFRMTPAGREQLAARIEAERSSVDHDQLHAAYDEFHHLNTEFKTLVTDWQVRGGQPNDHTDAAYDVGIMNRLADLDARWQPLLKQMLALAPRMAPYPARFAVALAKMRAGDSAWFARPILDSYHTVWFELHEDLIGLLGLSREAEAAAGRAE
ncbi:hypothetical protein [Diaphorobacter sp. HDW4B]|uniref:hypothetical protein n=1 Tax=Diaphorobacter sp. HDW4B TaxID=2714925 RepID=UPI00197A7A58|nr:hypothetical protein [Diaphorobacter sp. HDW4B]